MKAGLGWSNPFIRALLTYTNYTAGKKYNDFNIKFTLLNVADISNFK